MGGDMSPALAPVQAQPFLVRDTGGTTHVYFEIAGLQVTYPDCWLDLQKCALIDAPTDVLCPRCFGER